jgi:hypothetical protein
MSKKWSVVIQVVLVVAALAGSVYVALTPANSMLNWYNTDDAFFYYKVAVNFLSGHGFTFDGINLSNGFHPLWMLICLCVFWLAHFDLILPLRVLVIVSGLFNAATALVMYRMLTKRIHPAAAIVGSALWALLPSIYSTVTVRGMESAVSAFFIILLTSKAADLLFSTEKVTLKQMLIVGLLGALTILARLDNVFLVAVVGFFLMFKITRIPRVFIYDLVLIGLAMLASWVLRFGLEEIRVNAYSIYPTLGIAVLLKPMVYYFCGLYRGFTERKPWQKLLLQVAAAVISFVLMYAVMALLNSMGVFKMFSRSLLAIDAAICSSLIFCLRLVQRKTGDGIVSPLKQFGNWLKVNWKDDLMRGLEFSAPIALLMGIYVTFNKIVFGTFSPVSGRVKVWWSTLPNTPYAQQSSLLTLLGLSPRSSDSPWSLISSKVDSVAEAILSLVKNQKVTVHSILFLGLFLLLLCAVFAVLNARPAAAGRKALHLMLPTLLLGSLFQVAYYNTVGYQAMRSWYWISQMMTIILLAAVLLDTFFIWLDDFKPKRIWTVAVAVLAVALLCVKNVNYVMQTYPAHVTAGEENAYLLEVNEVQRITEPGAKIGMTGGGFVGYFIQNRTVVNMDGLINSLEYFQAMQTGTAKAFLDAIPLNYVYGNSYILLSSDPYHEILGGRLIEIGIVRGRDDFTLYRYEPNQ